MNSLDFFTVKQLLSETSFNDTGPKTMTASELHRAVAPHRFFQNFYNSLQVEVKKGNLIKEDKNYRLPKEGEISTQRDDKGRLIIEVPHIPEFFLDEIVGRMNKGIAEDQFFEQPLEHDTIWDIEQILRRLISINRREHLELETYEWYTLFLEKAKKHDRGH